MDSEIPPALLAKHPELVAVGEALRQLAEGVPVTAACIKCGKTLVAETVDATGALVIRCPDGHTFFRAKRSVPTTSQATQLEYGRGNPDAPSRGRLVFSLQRTGQFSMEYVWGKRIHQRWEGSIVEGTFARLVALLAKTGFPDLEPLAGLVPGTQISDVGVLSGGEWKRAHFLETNDRFVEFMSLISAVIGQIDPEHAYSAPSAASLIASVKRVDS